MASEKEWPLLTVERFLREDAPRVELASPINPVFKKPPDRSRTVTYKNLPIKRTACDVYRGFCLEVLIFGLRSIYEICFNM